MHSQQVTMIELQVEGMSCTHCIKAVTEALSSVPGATKVHEVNLEQGRATVEGSPDPEALVAAVKEAGYQADILGA
jgi:copper chaperone